MNSEESPLKDIEPIIGHVKSLPRVHDKAARQHVGRALPPRSDVAIIPRNVTSRRRSILNGG